MKREVCDSGIGSWCILIKKISTDCFLFHLTFVCFAAVQRPERKETRLAPKTSFCPCELVGIECNFNQGNYKLGWKRLETSEMFMDDCFIVNLSGNRNVIKTYQIETSSLTNQNKWLSSSSNLCIFVKTLKPVQEEIQRNYFLEVQGWGRCLTMCICVSM